VSSLPEFNSDTILLTANNRLARLFATEHNTQQISAGKTAWPSARIMPLGAWLQQCWQDSIDAWGDGNIPRLLNNVQESMLWERIVRANLPTDSVASPAAIAKLAQQAWQLQQAWRIKLVQGALSSLDSQQYAEWAQLYKTRCKEENWLDQSLLPDVIAEKIRAEVLIAPKKIFLAGFETITPQTRDLFSALDAAGCEIQFIAPPLTEGKTSRTEFVTTEEEIRAVARWTRNRLEENPSARIGIVVPDLTEKRNQIQRLFDEVLAPEKLLPPDFIDHQAEKRRPFNISQGITLLQYPLIATAFNLLSLKQNTLETSIWSALIRSPFIGGADKEFHSRSLCDYAVCDTRAFTASIATVQRIANNQSRAQHSPKLVEILEALQKAYGELPKFCSAREWAKLFSALLETAGWPSERSLSSEEFQLVKSWRELLDQFISTDAIAAKLDFHQAVSALRGLAAEQQFQPESFNEPVQVLGVYEALGQRFDHLWLIGFSDSAWPLRARANPFLPLAAQIAVGIPQASVEGAWQFAQQATQHLLTAADETVTSHTNRENDQALRPSPLLEHLALTPAENIVSTSGSTLYQAIQQSAQMENLENDFAAPEIAANIFRGGTALFKYQAACPFRAFAQVRLNAQAWPTPRIGLDASERGQILHSAMELLWLKLENQTKLLALDETEQTKQVNDAASKALEAWQQNNHHPLPKRFKTMETRRLTALIQDWLALEKLRLPFTVLGAESETFLPLAGLTIRLRQDRVDQLADGSVAIMDYKTGKPGGLPWKDDTGRPEEPQLPLYALASEKPVSALLFGKIKTGESAVIGIAAAQITLEAKTKGYDILDGTEQPTLEQRIETWREELTQLAHNFRAGDAQVDPKKPAACQYCHLTSLCRKNEILDVGFLAEEVEGSDHDE
jgi:ATP-dependent helicase/nuclease subunit B